MLAVPAAAEMLPSCFAIRSLRLDEAERLERIGHAVTLVVRSTQDPDAVVDHVVSSSTISTRGRMARIIRGGTRDIR